MDLERYFKNKLFLERSSLLKLQGLRDGTVLNVKLTRFYFINKNTENPKFTHTYLKNVIKITAHTTYRLTHHYNKSIANNLFISRI